MVRLLRSHHGALFTKPAAHIVLMLITITTAFSLAFIRMKHLSPVDQRPGLQSVDNTTLTPTKYAVATGLSIRNFLEFDILKNNFVADAFVWFSFDPHIPMNAIDDFYFGKATVEHKSIPYLWHEQTNTVVGYNIQLRFQTNVNYRQFPLDSHRIYLTLNNTSLPRYNAVFSIDPTCFCVADTLYAAGWSCAHKTALPGLQTTIITTQPEKKIMSPRIVFALDFSNTSFKRFIFITLPLFMIFFLSLFTLSFDPSKHYETILGIHAAIMTALISYNFVIETLAPKVAYFMLSDIFFHLFLILCFLIFLLDAICVRQFLAYRGFLVIAFHVLFLTAWGIVLFWWL
jgi:hypothetical protein